MDKVKKWLSVTGAVIACIGALASCGARKNTAPSRFYHALNSRYNIYFNGKTSFDEALKAMNDGYQENYTEQIHLFPVSGQYPEEKSTTGGPFDRAIEKGTKAIRLHSIKQKPPRKPGWQSDPKQVKLQAQEEFNPFLKHCWMLIAESHFYNGDFLTAAVTYSYITRHFAVEPEVVALARIRQARCYTELEWFYEANNALKKLGETGVPPALEKEYNRMYAAYLIRSEEEEKAIPYLQSAIKSERNKRQRSRQRYLLGQLYMKSNQNELAYQTFGKVASSNPPYEIEFSARIRQTEVFPGGNYDNVLKMLRRMAKSDKNKDFLDQVYYAMGNVYMTQPDTARAIECYTEGIEKSTQNGLDKAICQIRLGDIYFTQKKYLDAQPCFSGALSGLHKEYKDYDRVARLSETLDELVVYDEAVHLQDSLQVLARMTESERLAVVDKIIAQIIEEEKKAEEEAKKESYLANQEAIGSNIPSRDRPMPTMPTRTGDNSFYFYNTQVVAQGKTQFQNRWGKRPPEDNWRRRNKKMALLQTEEDPDGMPEPTPDNMPDLTTDTLTGDPTAQTDSILSGDGFSSDPKTREYYLQQIPLTEDDLNASNLIIEDGLFHMGMIYKDKLEDMNLSVGTFEELDRRFPDNEYRLEYYYQIYLMALRYKDAELAAKYKDRLLALFPESDYAVAISDPDFEYNIRMMDSIQDSLYEQTYDHFLAEDTVAVRRNYEEVVAKYPLSKLMPKFMFLNALTYVQAGDAEGFKEALTVLVEKYPAADVTELAGEMLRGLLRGRQLMQSSFSTMTWDLRFGLSEDGLLSAADSARTFSNEQETPHRMLLIYTTGSIDRNQLLYAIAAYNFANFRIKGFDLSFEEIGQLTLFTITGFNNFTEIMDYYRMIYDEGGYATTFDGVVTFFPFSNENYETLMRGKTLEEYMQFFVENYGETAPDLVARWRIRVDADKQADKQAVEEAVEEAAATSAKQPEKPDATIVTGQTETPETTQAEETQTEEAETTVKEQETALAEPTQAPEKEVIPEDPDISEEPESTEKEATKKETKKSVRRAKKKQKKEPQVSEEIMAKALAEVEAEEASAEKRADAKQENLLQKLLKKVKDSDEFKKLQKGVDTAKELAEEEETPPDSVEQQKPLERVDGELTFDQLQEIRKQEAEEKAVREAEETLSKEEAKKTAEELKKQQTKEKEQLRKEKEKATKERLIQQKKDRKAKEKEYKQKIRSKEKERKEREKDRKATLKAKEKANAAKTARKTKIRN
jgi:hypothetical protein